MDILLIPSLQHLSCCRVNALIFNHLEVQKYYDMRSREEIRCQVKDTITLVAPCTAIQEKLEEFIDPLLQEICEWISDLGKSVFQCGYAHPAVLESIPQCWLSVGTIHREKSLSIMLKKEGVSPMKRFEIACNYCCFDEILYLWNNFTNIERIFLKVDSIRIFRSSRLWIIWLESSSVKNWESFLTWSLENSLCFSNAFILKNALLTISPAERGQYLLNHIIENDISNYVMRFCISVMTKDELQQILRKSPAKVFKCILSWPLRPTFYDMVDVMSSYLTEDSFCNVLRMMLEKLQKSHIGDFEVLNILKNFWSQSPDNFQNTAKDIPELIAPLQFMMDFEVSQFFVNGKVSELHFTAFTSTLCSSNNMTEFHELVKRWESMRSRGNGSERALSDFLL